MSYRINVETRDKTYSINRMYFTFEEAKADINDIASRWKKYHDKVKVYIRKVRRYGRNDIIKTYNF